MKKKINVGVIGRGKWGKKFIPILKKKARVKFILDSKSKIPKKIENLKWVFVLTNNKKHEYFVNYFIKKKINVFCEKPLAENFLTSQRLFNIAKNFKVKLYVSDIELYKNKKIKVRKENIITRSKYYSKKQKIKWVLFKLFYHDIYLLGSHLINKKIISKKIQFKKNVLSIKLILNNKKRYNFIYSLKSKKKLHQINGLDMRKFSGNPLSIMIDRILFKRFNNNKNKKLALLANQIISKLLK